MDHPLNFHDTSFGPPFCPESAGFLGIALGAISLPTINTIIDMALWAMCFTGVNGGNGVTQHSVFPGRNNSQVGWFNAPNIRTGMIHHKPTRYIANTSPIGYPMSAAVHAPKIKSAIPVFITMPIPHPASILTRLNIFIKTLAFRFRHAVHEGNNNG